MTRIVPTTIEGKRVDVITLTIDGRKVEARGGATVLEAALDAGIYVPSLCYEPKLKPYGACRLCVVEIEGMPGLVTSCTAPATGGMVVRTDTQWVNESRRITMELIMANHHGDCLTCHKNQDCELLRITRYLGVEQEHFDRLRKSTHLLPIDRSHPAFDLDPNKCVLCARCVRVCHEIAGVGAIDLAFRGPSAKVSTFGDKPIVESICESCGECVATCPTGALVTKHEKEATHEVRTICPYCGVGCSIYLGVRGNEIVSLRGDEESPVNQGGLCVKGRFGYDFFNHPERLTKPLIRKEGRGKDVTGAGTLQEVFREASWDEALEVVARKLSQVETDHGSDSIAVLSSAKCTNEENYVLQKFTRCVLGTNNVDHCARLCHASTIAGAVAAFGSGAMTNSIADISKADLLFIIGSNTTECHPIIGRIIRQRVKFSDTKLIVADPRNIELSNSATIHLRHQPGTDVALINALMHVIIKEGLQDTRFIEDRTEDFEELAKSVKRYTPAFAEQITGVPKSDVIRAARLFAGAERACILYGMGITQHTTGTDNVKSVANVLMLTGNIGREGTGFSPLRGQNNVQGACDMGALPDVFPGYQRVDNPEVRRRFESAWRCSLSDKPGLTLTEMIDAVSQNKVKAMYIMGENPLMSEPYLGHTQRAMEQLGFLVVQDIFPTETAVIADVILPAALFLEKDGTFTNTERRVQKLRKAIDPPGEAKSDWEIISALAEKMGHPFGYKNTEEIMEEVASLTPIYGGIHHDRLDQYGLQWPCTDKAHPGTTILHQGKFTRGLGKFHPVDYIPPAESVSIGYPLLLTTGRVLEHWHTGSMSRRSEVLNRLYPNGVVDIHPNDAFNLGVVDGDTVNIASERGKIETEVHVTDRTPPGLAFMAFHWREAPANVLTNPAVDPTAKIPEFKVSAVRAVLAVLDTATQDNALFAQLVENPAKALKGYNLTEEERAAIQSGDIRKIESWVGKLDERLRKWLVARLQQEKW